MVTIKISGNKTKIFTDIVSTLSDFITDINLFISKERLYSQTIDKNKVSLCEFVLTKEWFERYDFDDDETLVLGVNFDILEKILKCRHSTQSIYIKYDNSDDNLGIEFKDGSGFDKSFEIPIYDIDESGLQLPSDVEWDATIKFNSYEFNQLMTESSIFSDTVRFICDDTRVILESRGDTGKYKVEIPEEKLIEYSIFEDENINIMYASTYLTIISSFSRIHFEEIIELSNKLPLRATYNLDRVIKKPRQSNKKQTNDKVEQEIQENNEDDEDEDEEDYEIEQATNFIRFYLAPKYDD